MSSAAMIPLQGTQPTFASPTQSLSQALQLRDMAGQLQLRQAQAAEYQAKAAAEQKAQQDQSTIQSTLADQAAYQRLHSGDFSDFAGKVSLGALGKLQDYHKQQVETAKAQSDQEIKERTEALGEVNKTLAGIAGMKNPDGTPNLQAQQQAWGPAIANLDAAGVLKRGKINTGQIPQVLSSPDQIQQYAAQIGGALSLQEQARAAKKEEAATNKDSAAAAKDLVETQTKNEQLQGMQGGLLPEEQVRSKQATAALAETVARDRESAGMRRETMLDRQERQSNTVAEQQRRDLDREIEKAKQPYNKITTDSQTALNKIDEVKNLINSGAPAGQVLGQIGSVGALANVNRYTHIEGESITNAQSPVGKLESYMSRISGNGPLNDQQRSDLTRLLDQAKNHITSRQSIINDHLNAVDTSASQHEIAQHNINTRAKLTAFENATPSAASKPIIQHSPSTGAYRYSTDGGKTWQAGQPQSQQ